MAKKKTNVFAKASLIFALLFWLPALNIFTSILAIVFGVNFLKDLKTNDNQKGKAYAIAGITIGIITLMLIFWFSN
jgi:hypothetical protein